MPGAKANVLESLKPGAGYSSGESWQSPGLSRSDVLRAGSPIVARSCFALVYETPIGADEQIYLWKSQDMSKQD